TSMGTPAGYKPDIPRAEDALRHEKALRLEHLHGGASDVLPQGVADILSITGPGQVALPAAQIAADPKHSWDTLSGIASGMAAVPQVGPEGFGSGMVGAIKNDLASRAAVKGVRKVAQEIESTRPTIHMPEAPTIHTPDTRIAMPEAGLVLPGSAGSFEPTPPSGGGLADVPQRRIITPQQAAAGVPTALRASPSAFQSAAEFLSPMEAEKLANTPGGLSKFEAISNALPS